MFLRDRTFHTMYTLSVLKGTRRSILGETRNKNSCQSLGDRGGRSTVLDRYLALEAFQLRELKKSGFAEKNPNRLERKMPGKKLPSIGL
ncbi:hypothetical protein TNCT_212171 [Trichonephila clavata]|uniref:Uncharacterized protein n=1 Tax=Trichonephila clavata TaxID=2740835 RepID=A0A8X6FWV4_TRICU|nr:hypothetical protein TNCT_212171 [Trichonephila clavata]